VLVLTSAPLVDAATLWGAPTLTLRHAVDTESAQLHVRLCRVDRRGRSTNLSDGHVVVVGTPGSPRDSIIRLGPAAADLPAGTRLRLVLSGTAHPAFASPQALAPQDDVGAARPRQHEIYVAPGHDSTLHVPMRSS
jgi:predicted acyl esterase